MPTIEEWREKLRRRPQKDEDPEEEVKAETPNKGNPDVKLDLLLKYLRQRRNVKADPRETYIQTLTRLAKENVLGENHIRSIRWMTEHEPIDKLPSTFEFYKNLVEIKGDIIQWFDTYAHEVNEQQEELYGKVLGIIDSFDKYGRLSLRQRKFVLFFVTKVASKNPRESAGWLKKAK
jgi:hypothetical protein